MTNPANTALTVAETIADQIGGKALYMLGATGTLLADQDSLTFDVKGTKACNKVVVKLVASDTYTLQFWKGRGFNLRNVREIEDVQVSQLCSTIESFTGLRTSL